MVVLFKQILHIRAAQHLDEANLVFGIQINDQLAFHRLQLHEVGDLDHRSGREAGESLSGCGCVRRCANLRCALANTAVRSRQRVARAVSAIG